MTRVTSGRCAIVRPLTTDDARALLITGAYGTGKTTLVEELATVLEERRVRYAAIDLDWLGWFDPGVPNDDHEAGWPVKLRNVEAVVANYRETGVGVFLLAGSVTSSAKLGALRDAIGMPLAAVRLTLRIHEIERRLATAVTSGRVDDLEVARAWLASGHGEEVGDLVVANDRPIREVALEVLAWFEGAATVE